MKTKESEEIFDRGINYFRAGFYSSALNEFYQVKKISPEYPNIDYIIEIAVSKNKKLKDIKLIPCMQYNDLGYYISTMQYAKLFQSEKMEKQALDYIKQFSDFSAKDVEFLVKNTNKSGLIKSLPAFFLFVFNQN